MDFVTITDHDTIDGVLSIADRPDVFVSEELTASFAGEPQAVHILCLGITPGDHEWLQAHADDVEVVAEYLREHEIACALAHPFFNVAAPLTARHRRRLAELFDVWEVRNGARAPELNRPASIYVDTHGGVGIGGSDDHAGVDIGRTWTQAPPAATPAEFLAHLRDGRVEAHGAQGSAAKWAHAAMAIAVRVFGGGGEGAPPDPGVVLQMVERVMSDGDARAGALATDMGPDDARAMLRAWLAAIDLDLPDRELLDVPPGRRLQPLGAVPARAALPRAQAAGGGRARARGRDGRRRRRLVGRRRRGVRGLRRRDPLRARDRLPEPREAQARRARRRPAAGRAGRRRHRRDPRRHPHARGAARARGARLRGRGDRHRRPRRPPAAVGRGGRGALLRGAEGRRAEPAVDRRGAVGGPLRPAAPVHARPGRDRRRAHGPAARAADRRLVPHGAGRLRGAALGRRGAEVPHRPRPGRLLRPVRRRALALHLHGRPARARSASRRSGSRAGTAASTSPASRPSAGCRGCSTPRASTSSTPGG